MSPYLAFQVNFFQFIFQVHETLKETNSSNELHFRTIYQKKNCSKLLSKRAKN